MAIARLVLFFLALSFACSSHPPASSNSTEAASSAKSPKIILRADPRQGFAPMNVTLHAQLLNVSESDQSYHCLKEQWDFGDGAISSQKPNCEPLDANGKIELDFIVEHDYQNPGAYSAMFTLGEEKKMVRSGKTTVTVLQNPRDPNGP